MLIRHATLDDLDAIASLETECFPAAEAASREQIATRLHAFANHFWLLFDGETLVSFINGMVTDEPDLTDAMYANTAMHREQGAWQMIFGVVTSPAYQHQGYASQLMRAVIDDTRAAGHRGLVLTCKERLIGFYERFGYRNEGVSASTHGDVVWYQMRITF
ncbi:acetyltransferase [Bifidobacterium goeldii]|uniref:Acetyltransferase n=1 Tax=Bifidobacterium goeldii TaxID=2306975 RepID=A0A430FNH6_9BIFI|nr:GNAT family N-acetyltransferase [Bifidobacterium goeldii]RSX54369.1 acetyltransferase [Bifidobacterium goeldii]